MQKGIQAHTVALFILGNPPTLQVADIRTGAARIIIENVGRSLHKIPRTNAISFVHKISEKAWQRARGETTSPSSLPEQTTDLRLLRGESRRRAVIVEPLRN